jgi:hypothetical protein
MIFSRRKFGQSTVVAGASGVLLLTCAPAGAGLTEIRIDSSEPFAKGASFGPAGFYVRMKGRAKGELDPKDPRNAPIVNLDKAPLNARGKVEYETDVYILAPADSAKRSGKLLYEVANRGRKFLFNRLQDSRAAQAIANDPATAEDAGPRPIALERGYVLVWSGWDADAPSANNGMTMRAPIATENGQPIVKRIREEIQIGTRGPADVAVAKLSYPAARLDSANARLAWRDRESDARQDIPPDQWAFVDARSIRLLPEGTKFKPLRIYELWYDATQPKVAGIGFAATRDLVSFLRYESKDSSGQPNPLAIPGAAGTGVTHALGFGISQSGRYLRHHVELGMNEDEQGRRVFDGVLAHTAGIGKVFANEAFAEPNRTATQHEDRWYPENWFPFAYETTRDPLTGKSGALLSGRASDPLVMETDTSTEYWQKGASLVLTDPAGEHDLADHPGVRMYLIAGTQHGGSVASNESRGACANPRNPHSAAPALRALLVALDEWAANGAAPPKSLVPRIADGTAVTFEKLDFPTIPGLARPLSDNRIGAPADWTDPPGRPEKVYGTRLPAVDADGNERVGLRLPDIAVPLGTFTGWNVYKGLETELCDRDGTYAAFAKTRTEREAAGDHRPSLEERYGSRQTYSARVQAAADQLVRDRLLLPVDAEAYARAAMEAKGF